MGVKLSRLELSSQGEILYTSAPMKNMAANLALILLLIFSLQAQTPQPAGEDRLGWAFPVIAKALPPRQEGERNVPDSAKTYTTAQIDDLLNPPDWYPDQHPGAPLTVTKGEGGAMACGACHLMSGLGHPESSDLTGLTVPYMVQQMLDFKSGVRKDPTGKRMNGIAAAVTDEQARAAAV